MASALWIAYLVPHRLRHRQQLLESRAEDRYSGALRVLAVTGRTAREPRVSEARTECGTSIERRAALLTPCRGIPVQKLGVVAVREGKIVDRPHGTHDGISADAARRAAQRRARRAASLARRGAAARRRGVLTLGLLAVSAAGWVVVGLTTLAVLAAVIPTVALGGVLVLGRRAVVQGKAADAAWDRQQLAVGGAGRTTTAPVTGRAYHPSDSPTQVIARIRDEAPSDTADLVPDASPAADADLAGVDAVHVDATGSSTDSAATESAAAESAAAESAAAESAETETESAEWSPVPVPRSTYTTKATAPRREPIPLVISEPEPAAATAAEPSQDLVGTIEGAVEAPLPAAGAPVLAEGSPTLDLDAILARRRAAG